MRDGGQAKAGESATERGGEQPIEGVGLFAERGVVLVKPELADVDQRPGGALQEGVELGRGVVREADRAELRERERGALIFDEGAEQVGAESTDASKRAQGRR